MFTYFYYIYFLIVKVNRGQLMPMHEAVITSNSWTLTNATEDVFMSGRLWRLWESLQSWISEPQPFATKIDAQDLLWNVNQGLNTEFLRNELCIANRDFCWYLYNWFATKPVFKGVLLYIYGCFQKWGTPKSSILIGFYPINHPFWGTPIFGNTPMVAIVATNGKHTWLRSHGVFTVSQLSRKRVPSSTRPEPQTMVGGNIHSMYSCWRYIKKM